MNGNDLKLSNGPSANESSSHAPTHTTIIHTDSKIAQQSTPSTAADDDDHIEIVTTDDVTTNNINDNNDNNDNDDDNDNQHDNEKKNDIENENKYENENKKHDKNETMSIPKATKSPPVGSMRIVLSYNEKETLLNPSPSVGINEDNISIEHKYSGTTIINNNIDNKTRKDSDESTASTTSLNSPNSAGTGTGTGTISILEMVPEDETNSNLQWKLKRVSNNNNNNNRMNNQPRTSMPFNQSYLNNQHHSSEESWNPDADFEDHTNVDGNHGFGPSVQIHDLDPNEFDPQTPIGGGNILYGDALPQERLNSHYLSDSVESLDPDFILEPAYFENSEVYSMSRNDAAEDSTSRGPEDAIPPPMVGTGDINKSIPLQMSNNSTNISHFSEASTVLSNNSSVNSLSSNHGINNHSMAVSKDMDFGSIQWTMPGRSMDQGMHQKSIQMMAASMQMINNINEEKVNNKLIGKSVQYDTIEAIGKSVQYEAATTTQQQQQQQQDNNSKPSSSIGGEGFVHWQMHGRKLMKMSHEQLVKWLESTGFDEETLTHFRAKKIDGKKLWQNIRNASMFLYNVGVVRPTLRDAIVQNIYLQLLPKTPGFDERHMSDFKRLQLIADGPISTVYKAIIKKEKLKLRESTVIIKGYHFAADEVRVGKIIQILVHMVTNITSTRFVKIHGFIRNMMEDTNNNNNIYQRPMFGIVMEFCDGGSLQSIFKNGQNKYYHFEYNIMDKIGILIDVARAMQELHDRNTLHRNLKASNVLISNIDDIKLTDYCLDVTQLTDFTHSGEAKERSIRWMSPELIQTQNYTKKCDIYSFGITMYEICSGQKPYHQHTNNIDTLLTKILQDNFRPDITDLANLPEDLLILMEKCWMEDPDERPPDFRYIINELENIKENLRESCIRFDDIYAQQRVSALYNYGKAFQSSPLLTMNDSNNEENNEYDELGVDIEYDDQFDNTNDNNNDYGLLQPYNSQNKPTHIKDDTALELDVLKNFEPRRRKIHKPKKKRPRKPLPKAPPNKALPQTDINTATIDKIGKTIQLPDKPLPPKPLFDE